MTGIFDINFIFYRYYRDNPQLRRIVTKHSELVAKKALEITRAKNLPLNHGEVYCAAMLHDIGVIKCFAPDIHAYGKLPYILHGIEGRKILEQEGLYQFASICDTHTGAGITSEEIIKNNLPLPVKNYLPSTLLEKLICYSDKFYSKSQDLYKEKTIDEIINQMKKYGEKSLDRFLQLHTLFSVQDQ